uniref:Uncharacterized protein n=1 Tax=Geospiza parvula TaxID=87175 RepID=A0A8C3M9E2_GEOPR
MAFLSAVGDFGRFQKCLVLLSVIPCLSVAFHQFCQLFMVVEVPHHCDTSWIRAVGPNLTQEEQLNLTLPRGPDGHFEQCSMFSPVDWDLDSILAYGLNHTEKCSSGWVYPSEQPPSLLTEVCTAFDLVCDRKDLNDIAQAIYMAGLLLGSMIFGPLRSVQACLDCAPCVETPVCLRGNNLDDSEPSFFLSATEWIGVSSRPNAVLTSHCCFAIGQMILAGLSYGIRNWRLLEIHVLASSPGRVLPESARWLVTKGRIEEAKKLLQKAAAANKRQPPTRAPGAGTGGPGLRHCPGPGSMPPCLAFRFVNSIVYYGLSLNVTNFGLDIYLTQLAFGAVEIPARFACIFTLQWFGRRKTQAVLLVLSGLVCLIITAIPEDQPVATTVLATIGKFAASASFSTSYVYAAELFPTVVRQTGVGLCSMSARVAGILAPLIRLLGQHHRAIPMAIFGSAPVLGGLLCILLPETRGTDLADDTGDGHPQLRWVLVLPLG